MKIRILSDLHLEFYREPALAGIRDDVDCDVIVLAGDIHVGTRGIEWAAQTFDRPVIYVLGNHEYYGRDYAQLLRQAREISWAHPRLWLPENDEVALGGVRFLGCTLWSGLESTCYTTLALSRLAEVSLQDFRRILDGRGLLTAPRMIERHNDSTGWLTQQIGAAAPAVVVTHFAPSAARELLHPQFGDDPLTPYFHNPLDHLMGAGVKAWIYGHNHWSASAHIEGLDGHVTPVISNQLGYPREQSRFAPDYVIET